jgi:aminoglycoside phosphotransferase (APT) family kinase protein
LAATATRTSLVHGDFNSKNLLRAENGSYVAIDPLPHIGDPCLDIGLFAAYQPPARDIARRAAAIAELAGMDPERATRWAAVSAVGEACETWRDDSDELQAWVAGPECAALLAEARL